MSVLEFQEKIIEGVGVIVDSKMKEVEMPKNQIGRVTANPSGYDCNVLIYGTEFSCTIPEHLHDWISKDDMVIVQDLYGNGSQMIVIGSHGSARKQTLVINDEKKERLVSGVTVLEGDGETIDPTLVIE